MKYQVDPHLRHDFPPRWGHQPGHVPMGRPPWLRPRRWCRRLRLWWRRQQYRLGEWTYNHLPAHPGAETAALQLLIVGLTLIVIFQAAMLVLIRPR